MSVRRIADAPVLLGCSGLGEQLGVVIDQPAGQQRVAAGACRVRADVGETAWAAGRPDETCATFEQVALADDFPKLLTIPAYELLG